MSLSKAADEVEQKDLRLAIDNTTNWLNPVSDNTNEKNFWAVLSMENISYKPLVLLLNAAMHLNLAETNTVFERKFEDWNA